MENEQDDREYWCEICNEYHTKEASDEDCDLDLEDYADQEPYGDSD